MLDKEKFIEELRSQHNDIGIVHDCDLCRLVGFHEDPSDYYYHVRYLNGRARTNNEKNDSYCSAVGQFLSLRGLIPERDYNQLDSTFQLNGGLRSDEFLVSESDDDFIANDFMNPPVLEKVELIPTCAELLEEDGFDSVHRESEDGWRHGSDIYQVYRRLSDNTFWSASYRVSTDGETHGLREDDAYIVQVRPVEKLIISYEDIKDDE